MLGLKSGLKNGFKGRKNKSRDFQTNCLQLMEVKKKNGTKKLCEKKQFGDKNKF